MFSFIWLYFRPCVRHTVHMEAHAPLRRTAVAAEVRAELARQNKTYTSLAAATDISVDTLRRRLNGLKPFYVEELGSVCRFLGITLDELIARAEKAQAEADAAEAAEALAEVAKLRDADQSAHEEPTDG